MPRSSPTEDRGVPGAPAPLISVLIPEARDDPRGSAEFLSSWTTSQTVDEGTHEVILIIREGDPALEAENQKNLRDSDLMLIGPFENCIACYNAGIEKASGQFVLLTENHTIAAPDCIERLAEYLRSSAVRAASIRSDFRSSGYFDRMEGDLYRKYQAEIWSREGEWNRVRMRGFLLERSLYAKIGGMADDYGLFAEEVFSSKLSQLGVPIGYAEEAGIVHVNAGTFPLLRNDIQEFVDGECVFRNRDFTPDQVAYFDEPEAWRDRALNLPGFRRRIARTCGRILFSTLGDDRKQPENFARFLIPKWMSLAVTSQIPRRLLVELREVPVQWYRALAFAFQFSQKQGLTMFERMWRAVRRKRERLYLAKHPEPFGFQLPEGIDFKSAQPPQLFGFHPLEEFDGRSLRWTRPVAAIRLRLKRGQYEVEIDTAAIRGTTLEFPLGIAFNNEVICTPAKPPGTLPDDPVSAVDGRIRFNLKPEWFVSDEQLLVLCAQPLGPRPGESRELGLPILNLRINGGEDVLSENPESLVRNAAQLLESAAE